MNGSISLMSSPRWNACGVKGITDTHLLQRISVLTESIVSAEQCMG